MSGTNPVELWLENPERTFTLSEVSEVLAHEFVNSTFRRAWDANTPTDGRDWYLRRDAGLWAYARREAEVRLRPFAKHGRFRGEDYLEAVLWWRIVQHGGDAAIASSDFDELFRWKRHNDVGFFARLGARLAKRDEPEGRFPDLRMRLYACLYDRGVVPLEFCTDDYAAWLINGIQRTKKRWLEKVGVETNAEAVRGWRRLLKLRLTMPKVVKFRRALVHRGEPEASQYVFNRFAASRHGVPFIPPKDSIVPSPKSGSKNMMSLPRLRTPT